MTVSARMNTFGGNTTSGHIESKPPKSKYNGSNEISRRYFIKASALAALGALFFGPSACLDYAGAVRTPEQQMEAKSKLIKILRNYNEITKYWHPIYGPHILHGMYGTNDFAGHMSCPEGAKSPGVDLDVPKYTPLVLPANGAIFYCNEKESAGLYLIARLMSRGWNSNYSHLSEVFVDNRYFFSRKREIQRVVRNNEIIALSGDSGKYISRRHLHFGLTYVDIKGNQEYFDPYKKGIDGGPPVFSDGKTDLSIPASMRHFKLFEVMGGLEERLKKMPEEGPIGETRGRLLEWNNHIKELAGPPILDSPHFHDMRAYLLKVTLEDVIWTPESEIYTLMLEIAGLSIDERQEIVLCSPFISPKVLNRYKIAVYNNGPFTERGNFYL